MKQFVKEAVKEFADKELVAPVKEIAKGEIGVFANEQMRGYLKKLLPDLYTTLCIAKSEEVSVVEIHCERVRETSSLLSLRPGEVE